MCQLFQLSIINYQLSITDHRLLKGKYSNENGYDIDSQKKNSLFPCFFKIEKLKYRAIIIRLFNINGQIYSRSAF
ncbi:hypothetical protein BGP_4307 [Beggiatoa sp. PS]|nr:hypothetical protein BGP_4307 [Beggiatoa sp. PS]